MSKYLNKFRSNKSSVTDLQDKIDKLKTTYQQDPRYWYLTVDKTLNGEAIIRFLDAPRHLDEEVPFVRYWNHSFKMNGQWYIENSLTSLGQPDPMGERNSRDWERCNGDKALQKLLSPRSRNEHYVMNILVIQDKANPENEGKVFLFRCGKQVFDKISGALKPKYESKTPVDVFDLFNGRNFYLRCKDKGGNRNYEDSEFEDKSTPICGGDEEMIDMVIEGMYSLQAEVSPDKFKSYEDLKKRVIAVLGDDENGEVEERPVFRKPANKPASESKAVANETETTSEDENSSEADEKSTGDAESYYEKIKRRIAERNKAA